ncbi:MAG: hydroxymethylbilane synthase [Solirubrobacteraceae bacterium]
MRLGTRASALALAQARSVAQRLGDDVELVEITTLGDRGAAVQDKSRWVSELEYALVDGRIDVAVHSAKDVPTALGEGLELVAIPPRADPRDVLCGAAGLGALTPGARVGTSSVRREAQLRAAREDIDVVEVRGNVDTRLRKLAAGEVDALVLAFAGLVRLGRAPEAGAVIDAFVPAAGQRRRCPVHHPPRPSHRPGPGRTGPVPARPRSLLTPGRGMTGSDGGYDPPAVDGRHRTARRPLVRRGLPDREPVPDPAG